MKAIIFDMDGVLYDTERISRSVWYQIAKEMGLSDIKEAVIGSVGRNRTDIMTLFIELYGKSFPAEEFLERTGKRYHKEIEINGLPIMDGTISILSYLKEHQYTIGLASSSEKSIILGHLKATNLTQYFDGIVGGDQVEHSKPQPDIYQKACEEIGAVPEESIAVEDSPNGIRAAYAAHMKAIMIPDLIEPDEEIKQLLYRQYSSLTALETALREGTLN